MYFEKYNMAEQQQNIMLEISTQQGKGQQRH